MREWADWLLGLLGTATWSDLLDVGLLAAAVYAVLRVLRGTRAFQSLVGLLLLVAVYLLSGAFGLSTLHWVLDNVSVYAVLALIILFQEDIRRVLAEAGTVFAGTGGRTIADANLIEEIVRAVFALAGRRIGALIAIERTGSLDRISEGADLMDAALTAELLQAIFHPTSPLHDGAVVVSRGRIRKAAVFVPISLSKTLPKIYGTRHRAAIGLTEQTDAVTLLVSEERGTVSIVMGGVVTPVVDPNDLRLRLQELLGAARTRPPAEEPASA
jgi:diadenylate cyclase